MHGEDPGGTLWGVGVYSRGVFGVFGGGVLGGGAVWEGCQSRWTGNSSWRQMQAPTAEKGRRTDEGGGEKKQRSGEEGEKRREENNTISEAALRSSACLQGHPRLTWLAAGSDYIID